MAQQGINCNGAHAAPVLIQHRIQFAIWFHDCDYAWLRRVTRSAFSEQGGLSLYRQEQFCASHKWSRSAVPTPRTTFSFCCPISLNKFRKVLSTAVRCVFWSHEVLHLRN